MSNVILFFVKLIFYYPGKFILWFNYFFPNPGRILVSRRLYKEGNAFIAFIYSMLFWIACGVIFLFFFHQHKDESFKFITNIYRSLIG